MAQTNVEINISQAASDTVRIQTWTTWLLTRANSSKIKALLFLVFCCFLESQ